jgi:hypothetical protein
MKYLEDICSGLQLVWSTMYVGTLFTASQKEFIVFWAVTFLSILISVAGTKYKKIKFQKADDE